MPSSFGEMKMEAMANPRNTNAPDHDDNSLYYGMRNTKAPDHDDNSLYYGTRNTKEPHHDDDSLYYGTGCSLNIAFFLKILKYSGLFSLCVSVCTPARKVEYQRWSRIGRVQKNHKVLRKNTILNEHPVRK